MTQTTTAFGHLPAAQLRTRSVEAITAVVRTARVFERAAGDLGLAQFRVLSAIGGGDARATRIARRLALGKPAVSAAVDALVRRGLVSRGAAQDQRAITLSLTPQGARLLAETEDAMARRLDDLLVRTADPDAVLDALRGLGEAVEAQMSQGCP